MRIGLDLDNTIICYDGVFHDVGCRLGLLPPDIAPDKLSVRAHLRALDREEDWTRLQGLVYGAHLDAARPYPGVAEFLEACRDGGAEVFIVSHRTRQPILGAPHDLHAAAREWLTRHGLLTGARGLPADHVFLETERAGKLARIARLGCDVFVDDLAELLGDPGFPRGVRRFLFDPGRAQAAGEGIEAVASWTELRAVLLGPGSALRPDARAVSDLLGRAGLPRESGLEALPHPGNNRVFRVASHPPALLKWYFVHPGDRRDRFGAEWALTRLAWGRGLRTVPEPLAADAAARLALYSLLPGRALATPSEDAVRQAAAFVRSLNAHRAGDEAAALPTASEACFSIDDHLRLVEGRLDRLAGLEAGTGAKDAAAAFVRDEVTPAGRDLLAALRAQAGEEARRRLLDDERILSPSDFGFHNALEDGGTIRFFDFEYAGWDDPAKMVCDFFCQPRVPVPITYWRDFTEGAGLSADAIRRADLLLPAYRLKWCCILLNDFLPEGRARRAFAGGAAPDEARLAGQLEKSRWALAAIAGVGAREASGEVRSE